MSWQSKYSMVMCWHSIRSHEESEIWRGGGHEAPLRIGHCDVAHVR